jgi:hypothetical protein
MKETPELSGMWLQARMLREQAKQVILAGGQPLDQRLEEKIFEEADKRIDAFWRQKRETMAGIIARGPTGSAKYQVIPESPWEKEWKENEVVLFEAEKR